MSTNYTRPANSGPPFATPAVPAQTSPPQQGGVLLVRTDIDRAVGVCPPAVRQELTGPCAAALSLLRDHLPAQEEVQHVCSGAVKWMGSPVDSVFAVTSRRLLFVAPAPQVLSFDLRAIVSIQCTDNILHLTAGSAEYQLGVARGYGDHFEWQVSFAVAVAKLAHA